ncbi:hypothetical protein FH039_00715 [Thermococcus indicus]|uniref:DUF4013 domain-containing protein n=1 Tax=Thermococcus indicus TaxID=2586643 RepID=A0A4Y5SI46_9EURY|nr:hypothetical protein [Thermococcus indicus]QDA30427.1 hypothetical protein FH039_00715 [Thermococcus indicus]
MKALEALTEAITSISEDKKLWRYPVAASGIAGALMAISGLDSNVELVAYSPDFNAGIAVLLVLIALLIRLTVLYYPTRAFYHHKKGIPFEEPALIRESVAGGIMVLLVGIVYGIVILIVGGLMLFPAILAHYALSGTTRYVIAGLLGLPPAIFLIGIITMMIPAYIWTKDFGEGLRIIETALDNAREVFVFGALMGAVIVGIGAAAGGLVFMTSLFARGFTGALLAGLIDGLITGLASVLSAIAGAAMYRALRAWEEKRVNIDPDWLASL